MIAPTLVALVRVLWLVLHYPKQDVYWMVADLTLGKGIIHPLSQVSSLPIEQTWNGNGIGERSSPEGREHRVESQAIRQAPDHHPRLQ